MLFCYATYAAYVIVVVIVIVADIVVWESTVRVLQKGDCGDESDAEEGAC